VARRRTPRPAALRAPAAPDNAIEPVRIERIAAGGDGVGRLADGRAVFVARSAPGDALEVRNIVRHKSYARAEIARVVTPGAGRVDAPCQHYVRDRCGGCQLQHLDAESQRAARGVIVGDALRRVGRLEVSDPVVDAAPSQWEYRTRITLHQSADGRRIGYHRADRAAEIFELDRCLLAAPAIQELWAAVRSLRRFLPQRIESLTLRLERGGDRHVLVKGVEPAWAAARQFAEALRARVADVSVWWQPPEGASRVMGEGAAFPATVFEQVHPVMGDRARHWAVDALGDMNGSTVWDLYAGIGETSRLLAARGARVISVEADARAVELASHGGSVTGVTAHAARVEDVVETLPPADLVVTNPPRAGMDSRTVRAIGASAARRLVYVSCDPATLARDLRGLGEGWRVSALRAFDLFPQTAHVETVAVLEHA
jgi:23S rRNA (uracil1939-C5)-methyltransferase